jgi:hypothetical protein
MITVQALAGSGSYLSASRLMPSNTKNCCTAIQTVKIVHLAKAREKLPYRASLEPSSDQVESTLYLAHHAGGCSWLDFARPDSNILKVVIFGRRGHSVGFPKLELLRFRLVHMVGSLNLGLMVLALLNAGKTRGNNRAFLLSGLAPNSLAKGSVRSYLLKVA